MPATSATSTRITARQRACPHPPANVHPTYDDRWETCDLCHIIRSRPLPAPWIAAYDAAQPAPQPPALFAETADAAAPMTVPVPTKRPRVTLREQPQPQPQPEEEEEEEPRTFRELLHAARRDRAIMGRLPSSWRTWPGPTLDEMYTPDQITACHRCKGAGVIADNPYKDSPHLYDPVRYEPAPQRTCPRCDGAGRIPKYMTRPA